MTKPVTPHAPTPGPWEVVGPFFDVYQAGTSEYICQSSKAQGDRRAANARLIAAAPTMRDAINQALDALAFMPATVHIADAERHLRAALAKAEGGK